MTVCQCPITLQIIYEISSTAFWSQLKTEYNSYEKLIQFFYRDIAGAKTSVIGY
jgi:hypothetical protein